MDQRRYLESYGGQSLDQLIGLESHYRVDSLVLAIEHALAARHDPNPDELVVLAVEAMEREVDGGGFIQFFSRPSHRFAGVLVDALLAIRCPKTAAIARRALDALRLAGPPTPRAIAQALARTDEERDEALEQCDRDYYLGEEEPLTDHLFEFIKRRRDAIRVG